MFDLEECIYKQFLSMEGMTKIVFLKETQQIVHNLF